MEICNNHVVFWVVGYFESSPPPSFAADPPVSVEGRAETLRQPMCTPKALQNTASVFHRFRTKSFWSATSPRRFQPARRAFGGSKHSG